MLFTRDFNSRSSRIKPVTEQGKFSGALAHHDPVIKARIGGGPQNAKYTLKLLGKNNLGQEKICSNICSAGVFSLLADETKDIGKCEQLAIAIRYVNAETKKIHENFLTYVEAASLDAESLSTYLLDTLYKLNLDPKNMGMMGPV